MAKRIWKMTEVLREGQSVQDFGEVFEFSSVDHSSPTGSIQMGLSVKTMRKSLPGTEEPVEQVISSALVPFTVKGQWSDRWMGKGAARDTWVRFEKMVRRGNLVRIDFDNLSFIGLVTSFVPVLKQRDVVPYEFTYSPHVRGGDLGGSMARLGRSAVRGVASLLQIPRNSRHNRAVAEALKVDIDITHEQMDRNLVTGDSYENVGERLDSMRSIIDELDTSGAQSEISAARDNVQRVRREISIHRRIRGECQKLMDETGALAGDLGTTKDDVVDLFSFDEWNRTIRISTRGLIWESYKSESSLDERGRGRGVRRHTAVKGQSVYEISTKYYGSSSEWRRILDANNVNVFTFEGGEILVIPEASEKF
jgi:hypothetical protein